MTEITQISYFQKRMNDIGVTADMNVIDLWNYDKDKKDNVLVSHTVFEETKDGIFIRVYGLDRMPVNYAKQGSRWKRNAYGIIRLETPIVKPNGDTLKYLLPKGQPVLPFFHPELVRKYETGEKIKVLYLTEGYFKAFKAQMEGLDTVGLTSITAMRSKETGKLHDDIHKIILKCNVESIVWLTDGDCRDITSKEIKDGIDLYKRPAGFFRTIQTFSDLLSKYDNLKKYFAHVNSQNLDGKPKGIDDLLARFPEETDKIIQEFTTFEKEQGVYSVKYNISFGLGKIHRYFMLHDVDIFYLHHVEIRPEIKGKEFIFNGTTYQYVESEGKCIIKVPSSAANYFRVGDNYYEYVKIPNRFNQLQQQYHRREKGTIKDDNGKDIFKFIPKYKAFCTVPDHANYQRIINNCFNLYFPFEWEAEQGDIEITINFIKHIFGTDLIKINEETTVERYQLGLDYLQLLYKNPQQTLPILSLVSTERQTGKTTFLKWLSLLFTENVAIVGNDDLGAAFNAHWASKLIVACDETKIDKHIVMEKVKFLSTASSIMMNAKGRDQVSMEFFAKFILCSNNEDNFAQIDKEEIRFWVIKVPSIPNGTNNVDMLNEMKEEIPAFINFLNGRKMVTERKERHWFETRLLKTEALEKVQQNSRPSVEKLIHYAITELFERSELEEICMPLNAIATELLKRPNDKDYIKRVLNNMGYATDKTGRRSYPRLIEKADSNGHLYQTTIPVSFHGKYYQFLRNQFINPEENKENNQLPF